MRWKRLAACALWGGMSAGHGALEGLAAGRYRLRTYLTGYRRNGAYSAYIDLRLPDTLSTQQVARLRALTQDRPERDQFIKVDASGHYASSVPLRTNDLVLVKLEPAAAR